MRPMRLLCDANPMAYGSSACLAAILAALEIHVDVLAIGRDVSLEFLRASAFDSRVIDVNVKDPREVEAVLLREKPDAALVVANHANLRIYASAAVPVFFVDVLFWYGEHKDEDQWACFERGFAVDFPGVRDRIEALRWRRPPTVVGPLLRELPGRRAGPRGTLVNLGGVRSVFVTPERARAGLAIVANILRAIEHALPSGEVVIACGSDAAEVIRSQLPPSMRVGALSTVEYDTCLQNSALLLTVPGLNAVLEGMAAATPLAFLPALNASQCLQLLRYQRAGVGALGIQLDRHTDLEIPELVTNEQALSVQVLAALERVASSTSPLQAMADAVQAQLPVVPELTQRRREFVDSLGVPGAKTIATAIVGWWQERMP